MTVFLTGGAGFIGSAVARLLRQSGLGVRALVQRGSDGRALESIGCEVIVGDVRDFASLEAPIAGCDSVIHGAAVYRVGIPKSQRRQMYDTNVTGTRNVLTASAEAGVRKVVYLSSVIVFGNTRGNVVDEGHVEVEEHPSYYARTKRLAHGVALDLTAKGSPCVIVQPALVYGPGDHSHVGYMIRRFVSGRLPFIPFPEAGFDFVHRDDVAMGVVQALVAGRPGHRYVLGGERSTAGEFIATLARVTGRRPPRKAVPPGLMKASAPFGSIVGPMVGLPPNLRELIASMEGITVWADHAKAKRELGYTHRSLEQGLRDTLMALQTPAGQAHTIHS